MYAKVTRLPALLIVLLSGFGLVACGDDSDSGSTGNSARSMSCVPGMMSIPCDPTTNPAACAADPCPQDDPVCSSQGGQAIATCCAAADAPGAPSTGCSAPSTWSLQCQCIIPPKCGNGAMDPGEDCDTSVAPVAATCASLGMGTGPVSCNPSTCMYDMSMCIANVPMGGAGG